MSLPSHKIGRGGKKKKKIHLLILLRAQIDDDFKRYGRYLTDNSIQMTEIYILCIQENVCICTFIYSSRKHLIRFTLCILFYTSLRFGDHSPVSTLFSILLFFHFGYLFEKWSSFDVKNRRSHSNWNRMNELWKEEEDPTSTSITT